MSKRTDITVTESEDELIAKAQTAVSQCNWVVGECASKWTRKYARGRTDVDFGGMVGLSGDQVFQRRRVWESFGRDHQKYPLLKWSHFYVALNWEDSSQCFDWAQENESTVAEMRAWRRAVRGEDLTQDGGTDEWGGDPFLSLVPTQPQAVRAPQVPAIQPTGREPAEAAERELKKPDEDYAPFRKGATSPAPSDDSSSVAVVEKPHVPVEQLAERAIATLVRMNKALTPEALGQFRKLPSGVRNRFVKAVGELSTKAARLM